MPNPVSVHAAHVERTVDSTAPARSYIAASWRRSLLHHGLSPSDARRPDRVSGRDLLARRQKQDLLLHIARPILERLFRSVVDMGCCVVLTDADCVMLDVLANDSDIADLKDWRIAPGNVWDEGAQGTNGMGTCRAEERPVLVFKDDHFSALHIGVSCMGAPIFGPDGAVAGILDVSTARSDLGRGEGRALTSLVAQTATQIETELFRASFADAQIVVADGYCDFGTPLLASDLDDLVIGANRAARRLLGLTAAQLEMPLPVSDLVDSRSRKGGLEGAERAALRRALARAGGKNTEAAKELGVSRATLYRMLHRHGLGGQHEV